jgi:hypothetical protein
MDQTIESKSSVCLCDVNEVKKLGALQMYPNFYESNHLGNSTTLNHPTKIRVSCPGCLLPAKNSKTMNEPCNDKCVALSVSCRLENIKLSDSFVSHDEGKK